MGNNNPIKVDLDRFENNIKDIREVSREIIADNTVCDEPSKFIADNPIIQDYCDFHNEILDLLKTFKKENELFTDRLSEIGENYRAMNDTATQRISADKVEHNAMPVSTKVQTGSSLNAPVSTMPKLEGGFLATYKTGNSAVDAEIEALFTTYGEDLSGLQDEHYLQLWDELSDDRKKALARIYYMDMNSYIMDYSNKGERLENILSLMQDSSGLGDGTAFSTQRLNELEEMIIPDCNCVAKDVIEKLKTFPFNVETGGLNGLVKIQQTGPGVAFYVQDYEGNEFELGFYTNQYRSLNYLTNLSKSNPGCLDLFKDLTGYSYGEMAEYLNTASNTSDYNAMIGLLMSDGSYDEVTCVDPNKISSGSMLMLSEYSRVLLENDKQQEYLDYINAFLNPNVDPEMKRQTTEVFLDRFYSYSIQEAETTNMMAFNFAYNEVRKDLESEGTVINDGYEINYELEFNEEKLEKILKSSNMNASMWTVIRNKYYHNGGFHIEDEKQYYSQVFFRHHSDPSKKYNSIYEDEENTRIVLDYERLEVNENGVILSNDDYDDLYCTNSDGDMGHSALKKDITRDAWIKLQDEKKQVALNTTENVIAIICPKIGMPMKLVTAYINGDANAAVGAAIGTLSLYFPDLGVSDKEMKVIAELYKSYNNYSSADYNSELSSLSDLDSVYYGVSYTPNGMQVIEYANMYKLIKWDYLGIKMFDGTVDEFDSDKIMGANAESQNRPGEIVIAVEDGFQNKEDNEETAYKGKYTHKEVTAAVHLVIYGKIESPNNCYNSISDIPEDLRDAIFGVLQDKVNIREAFNYNG